MSLRNGRSMLPLLPVLALAGGMCVAGACRAHDTDPLSADVSDPGSRGMFSITWQTLHSQGLITETGVVAGNTTTDTRSVLLALDYRLDDRWEAHVAVPYISKRSNGGPGAHRLDLLTVPHPEAQFLDDGAYHSGWQDWALGMSYHADWRGFHVEPRATLVLPSHDYSFFANAAIGQNLRRLNLSVDVTRRPDLSNFYWSAGYGYELVEEILGIGLNKHYVRLSAGYFFSPQWSARVFTAGRFSQGRDAIAFANEGRSTEFWYQHDRLSRHNYALVGIGATYFVDDRYALTFTTANMVWGRTVHELRNAYEVQLSRAF